MESVCCTLMAAFIRMDQDRQHTVAFPDLYFVSLWPDFKDVIRVNEFLVTQKSVKLVFLRELVVFFG
jgi:hypothetical protein